MSGSESSAPAGSATTPAEALSFTVHGMPSPELGLDRRRVVRGRLRMLLILLACAAPVVASYFTYYVIRPQGRTNYATLISPSRGLPADLALTDLNGHAVPAASLKGQWLLVTVSDGACDAACERRVYLQRQLREMVGRDSDRVDRVWFVTGAATPSPRQLEAAALTGGLTVLRADRTAIARWLEPAAGQALEDHLYLVDPMGEWMMRAPADVAPAKFKRDLERLLRASSSWDRAGR
jgi:hypothetical protein